MSVRLRFLYRAYRYRFRVDPAEIGFVRRSLRPGQVAVDVGCHKGAYTYWMRRSVGRNGIVYAFEPQSQQVTYLREAFSAMRYDNVVLVPKAVSGKSGQMPLYEPAKSTHLASLEPRSEERGARDWNQFGRADSQVSAPGSQLVDVTTLDEFFTGDRKPPHFVKIDVEGHELSALEGARHTLELHQPTILLECEARHRPDGDVRPVLGFLVSLGYTGTFFAAGARRPLDEFDPAVHQRLDTNSDQLPPGYVNNFAFEFAK